MKFIIHRLATCASTNDAARELAAAGAPEGTIVTAEAQTAGRGTKGRSWHSPPGPGLYVSILLRPAIPDLSFLPLAAGLAARDAVESSHALAARLRWPNDILFGGRKLGGVLCESAVSGGRPEFAIVGIGLNVNHRPADFPPEIRDSAVSLAEALGRPADPGRLFDALLAAFDGRCASLAQGDTAGLVRSFNDLSVFRPGDPVLVDAALAHDSYSRASAAEADPRVRPGAPAAAPFLYEGIGPDGHLRVRDAAGALHRFASAEVRKGL